MSEFSIAEERHQPFGLVSFNLPPDDEVEQLTGEAGRLTDETEFSIADIIQPTSAAEPASVEYRGGGPAGQEGSKRTVGETVVDRVKFARRLMAEQFAAGTDRRELARWFGKTRGQIFAELAHKYLPRDLLKKVFARLAKDIYRACKRSIRALNSGDSSGMLIPEIDKKIRDPDVFDDMDVARPDEIREIAESLLRAAAPFGAELFAPRRPAPRRTALPTWRPGPVHPAPRGRDPTKWAAFIDDLMVELRSIETYYITLARAIVHCDSLLVSV